jgi:zinc protease
MVGNSILGQFGMMGRIGDAVREKAGLAYYAFSDVSGGVNGGPGSWDVSAGVNPRNLDKAVDLIIKELAKFAKGGVTKEELADCKANFIGRLPLSLESNSGVAGALMNMERHQLGLEYLLNYADMIGAVTREDVLAVARKYIDVSKLAIATAGP